MKDLQLLLNECNQPIVVIGNGIKASNTKVELLNFLKQLNLPVMSGPHSAVDVINNDYELYAGRFGLLGQRSSNKIIETADLIISLGSRLNPKMIGYDSTKFAKSAVKFIIDIDKAESSKLDFPVRKCITLCIDLKDFF